MKRIIATSFDNNYFQQGINLIASLHRTSLLSFDHINVYDLNFSDDQRKYLNDLEKVNVVDYPDWCRDIFEGFLEPKNRAYKSFVIKDMGENLGADALVLWMDAGLSCFGDIDEIFKLIEEQEFFIPDHDDKPQWPFYNINFTHREAIKVMKPSGDELLGVQLCSCLVGYKTKGKYQHLIDEAFELGKQKDVVLWPKVPQAEEKFKAKLNAEQKSLKEKLLEQKNLRKHARVEDVLPLFDYYGHRTQSIYSILAHRYNAPFFSAKRYRRSNDISSAAAIRNWAETAKNTDGQSSFSNLEGMDEDVLIYHHRGVYNNLEGLRFKRPSEHVFIMGNGPSLKEVPLDEIFRFDTIGMNAAYRYWDTVNMYPTYYCCMDTVVLESHKEEVKRLIDKASMLGIRRFFLRRVFLDWYPEHEGAWNITFLEDIIPSNRFFDLDKVTTGSYSLLFAWYLGYRSIDILGVDLNYVEKVEGAALKEGRVLEIEDDSQENPNYFFDGYQVKGDKYNPPNPHPNLHVRAWHKAAQAIKDMPCNVTNLNPESRVKDFPFDTVANRLKQFGMLGAEFQQVAENTVSIAKETLCWRERTLTDFQCFLDPEKRKIDRILKKIEKKFLDYSKFEYLKEIKVDETECFARGWHNSERIKKKLCRWTHGSGDVTLIVPTPKLIRGGLEVILLVEAVFDDSQLELNQVTINNRVTNFQIKKTTREFF